MAIIVTLLIIGVLRSGDGYKGTQTAKGGEVEVVQVQGGGTMSMTLSAYDLAVGGIDPGGADGFVQDTFAGATLVKITSVTAFNTKTKQAVTVQAEYAVDGKSMIVSGFGADTTIVYTTDAPHDAVNVYDGAGKWDLGGFNLTLGQDTPDALLNFSVKMTDNDGDHYGSDASQVFDDFQIVIDGTGIYNNSIYESII
jgi:hypothetical protein